MEVGGGVPYKGNDGQMYKRWNGAAYNMNNRKLGYLATKVKFMLRRDGGRTCVAQGRMPRSLRAPDYAQEYSARDERAPDDADLDADPDVKEAGEADAGQEDLALQLEEGLDEVVPARLRACSSADGWGGAGVGAGVAWGVAWGWLGVWCGRACGVAWGVGWGR